jgi:hypothetical protein
MTSEDSLHTVACSKVFVAYVENNAVVVLVLESAKDAAHTKYNGEVLFLMECHQLRLVGQRDLLLTP